MEKGYCATEKGHNNSQMTQAQGKLQNKDVISGWKLVCGE